MHSTEINVSYHLNRTILLTFSTPLDTSRSLSYHPLKICLMHSTEINVSYHSLKDKRVLSSAQNLSYGVRQTVIQSKFVLCKDERVLCNITHV